MCPMRTDTDKPILRSDAHGHSSYNRHTNRTIREMAKLLKVEMRLDEWHDAQVGPISGVYRYCVDSNNGSILNIWMAINRRSLKNIVKIFSTPER